MVFNPASFKSDGIHPSPAGYDVLVAYIQKISSKTDYPLIPVYSLYRDSCLDDPFKHLAIGMPEKRDDCQDRPHIWNPRVNSGVQSGTSHEHLLNDIWFQMSFNRLKIH